MIVDTIEEVQQTLQYIKDRKTLLVPIYCSPTNHPAVNRLCAIYIYTEDDVERMIPMYHTEQLRGFSELVPEFMALQNIFVHDKKRWLQTGGNNAVWDVKTLWWYTYGEAYDATNTLISTSCVVDVLSDTFANLPLSGTDSIAGTEKPTLSSQSTNSDTTITTWSTLTAGNYIQAEIESTNTGVAKIVIAIKVTKS